MQSAFRLYVDEITPDVVEAALNADSLLRWESVRRVDLFCEQFPKCPICLEVDMVVPKITKCGHVFCFPCVMRYFLLLADYNGKSYQPCPVCKEGICPPELTSARFEEMKALRENQRASFLLVRREVNSTIVRTQISPTSPGDPVQLPSRGEPGWHYSRLVRLQPSEAARLLQEEVEALKSFKMVVQSDGERELLPSVNAALELAQRGWEERRHSADEGLLLPEPALDLPEEADEGGSEGADVGPLSEGEEEPSSTPQLLPRSPSAAAGSSSPAAGPSGSSPGMGRAPQISFYQAADGRPVFLEPFFTKLLLHEHGGWTGLPPSLDDLRLGKLQETTISEDVRRRHKFLSHLPLGTVVTLAEVDLRNHLGPETKEFFAEEFNKRRAQKKKEQNRDKRAERIGQSRAAEEEERYYQALNLNRGAAVQQKPTAEDFAVPLPGREVEQPSEEAGGEGAGADEQADAGEAGPTLADKLRGKIAAKAKPRRENLAQAFPTLGGSSASASQAGPRAAEAAGRGAGGAGASSSAWGRGCGSSRVKKDAAGSEPAAAGAERPVGTGWDDDDDKDQQPTLGQALEHALRSSEAQAEQPGDGDGAKKKKGRAGKATTIRLFG